MTSRDRNTFEEFRTELVKGKEKRAGKDQQYFNPPQSVISLVPVAAAPSPADPTGLSLSTSIDQAAPSARTSSTVQETQSLVIYEGFEE
ncbi:hypothetical protein Tco_1172828 [Tanacetum coccineum]